MFAPQQGGYEGGSLGGSSGGLLGFLNDALHGYQTAHKEKADEQSQKAEMSMKKQQLAAETQRNETEAKLADAKLGQDVQTQAQGRVSAIMPAIFADPKKATDPQYVQSIMDSYKQMGLPAPVIMGKDGTPTIDVSGFKKDVNSLPVAQIEYYQGLDPQHRAPYLDALKRQGYDIPDTMYSDTAMYSAKDQAALANVHVRQEHEAAWEKSTKARTDFQRQRTQYLDQLDAAKTTTERAMLQGRINEMDAKTSLYKAQIPAIQERLNQGQQRIGLEQQRLNDVMTRFRASPHSQQNQLVTQSRQALEVYNSTNRTLQDAIAKRDLMVSNNVDSDDSGFMAINNQIESLQGQLQGLSQLQAEASTNLISGLSTSSSVSAASGRPTTTMRTNAGSIGRAPSGAADGYYPNAKGGPVTIKNGQMYKGQV
jgi:hypothetical protein